MRMCIYGISTKKRVTIGKCLHLFTLSAKNPYATTFSAGEDGEDTGGLFVFTFSVSHIKCEFATKKAAEPVASCVMVRLRGLSYLVIASSCVMVAAALRYCRAWCV